MYLDTGAGQLFGHEPPARAPLQRERHIGPVRQRFEPLAQVRPRGGTDLARADFTGLGVHLVECDLSSMHVKTTYDCHWGLLVFLIWRIHQSSPCTEGAPSHVIFLSIYWRLLGEEDPAWATRQVQWLYSNHRGFDQRTHIHTGFYEYRSTAYREDDGVPVELALDHHYEGLGVVMVEPRDGSGPEDLIRWLDGRATTLLFTDPRIDMVASFTVFVPDAGERPEAAAGAKPAPGSPGGPSLGSDGGAPDRVLQLIFVESNPVEVWERVRDYAAAIGGGGRARATFVAPFLRTVVGTDTYVDQIW